MGGDIVVIGGDQAFAGLLVGDRLVDRVQLEQRIARKYIWVIIRCVKSVPNSEKWMCAGRHALWWFFHGWAGLMVVKR